MKVLKPWLPVILAVALTLVVLVGGPLVMGAEPESKSPSEAGRAGGGDLSGRPPARAPGESPDAYAERVGSERPPAGGDEVPSEADDSKRGLLGKILDTYDDIRDAVQDDGSYRDGE